MSVTRDCACPVAKHEHGTEQAYISDKCRCPDCRLAHTQRAAWRRRMQAYNRDIAHLVPAIGSTRRLEALAWSGWSSTALAAHLGCDPVMLHRVRQQPRIIASKAAAITDMYERLWNQPPPAFTRGQRISIGRTREQARKRGYAPPLAWDDETIDDPAALPLGSRKPLQPCGTRAAYVRHKGRGEPIDKACAEGYRVWNRDRMRATRVKDTAPEFVDETAVEEAMRGRRVTLTDAERHEAIRRLTAAGKSASAIASLLNTTGRTVTRRRAAEVAA